MSTKKVFNTSELSLIEKTLFSARKLLRNNECNIINDKGSYISFSFVSINRLIENKLYEYRYLYAYLYFAFKLA